LDAVVDVSLSRLFRVRRAAKDDLLKIIYMPPVKDDKVDHGATQKLDNSQKFDCRCG